MQMTDIIHEPMGQARTSKLLSVGSQSKNGSVIILVGVDDF